MDKTDIPGTFNAGATLGPVNETNMARIWNKHKQTNTPLKSKVFVAMSGGVDSSVTAALLQERGFDVVGVHIKMWSDPSIPCNFKEDRYDAMRVAEHLGIPFQTWDFTDEYKKEVVEYLIREYSLGRTPNPDVMCNRYVKFGIFLREALKRGADYIATGHYVRFAHHVLDTLDCSCGNLAKRNRHFSAEGGSQANADFNCPKHDTLRSGVSLLKGIDPNKDQSYFLWTLTQDQLKHCMFPIGEYTKPEVRVMAEKFGLPTAEKRDSQGICFIGEINLQEFLKKYIPVQRGVVMTMSGKVIGEHEGLPFYTIGQREGLGIGGGIPYYVAEKDFKTNTLRVAEGPYDVALFSQELRVVDMNWIAGVALELPHSCEARIRYRQKIQVCTINAGDTAGSLRVVFNDSQRAVTSGQSIVFYDGDVMLGGGVIA